jgi:hypothetical protein
MSWLYESFSIPSAVNGTIRCDRLLGQWSVTVGNTGQANGYLNALWRRAVKRIPQEGIKRILMLGLGSGGAIPEFHRRFPRAHITAIEIDPVMVELAHRFGKLKNRFPEVHVGSAADILPTLTGHYDLIVSDMFMSHAVAPDTTDASVQQHIARLLHPQGHLLINAYDQPQMADVFSAYLVEVSRWRYLLSTVGHFRPHGAGIVGDVLPQGYVPYAASADYLKREYTNWPPFEVIQAGDAWGVRRMIGPISVERYVGNAEPKITSGGFRYVIWDPITKREASSGWRRSRGAYWRQLTGYADLTQPGELHEHWSELARRERKKWLSQEAVEIRAVDVDTYCRAYARSNKRATIIRLFSDAVRRKAQTHGERLHVWAAVSKTTGDIVAGFVALDVPEIRTTIHVTGFVLREAYPSGAGTGLIDHWLTTSRANGLHFADFDGFYAPGAPKDWKGFSKFKAQFGTRYIAYPHPFWRFVR